MNLPPAWQTTLANEWEQPHCRDLRSFLHDERQQHTIYPPEAQVFAALEHTTPEQVRVVILGQDPYHGPDQAHGLSFSVRPGVDIPPSLRNIFRELKEDVGCTIPPHGCLLSWAKQGVLLLNAVLTVRDGEANSHRGKGWERMTDAIIRTVSLGTDPVVFLLWGKPAQAKESLIDSGRHAVLKAAHPSPLSARQGFFGCRHFSQANERLASWCRSRVDWQIPNEVDLA